MRRTSSPLAWICSLSLLAACSGADKDAADDTGGHDAPGACGYATMPDLDPADGAVEVDLRASAFAWDPGTGVPLTGGLAFNEAVPGPVLEATLGDHVVVHFTNDTDIPMSLHWHGLRVTPEMDGVMQMMGDPIEPGESFDYSFDLQDAGFYWFHTHMDTAITIEAGLYASIVVHAPGEVAPDCDLPLVLDDVLLDRDDQIAPPDTSMMQVMGRLGNLLLANGRAGRAYEWTRGQTSLLRLVNTSNARYFDVYLEDHALEVVGTDGGFLDEPYAVDHLVLAPGERYLVVVEATGEPGAEYRLMNRRFVLHDPDGHMVEMDPLGDEDHAVATFVYGEGEMTGSGWTQPTPDVPAWGAAVGAAAHHWVLDEDMMGGTVTIDGASWPDVPLVEVAGATDTTFEVENASEMHHPFHIHGNRFQVVAVDGEPVPEGRGWKDTFDVAPESTVTVVSALDNPGEWMYHCHILEHAEDGMAGLMEVGE